MMLLKKHLKTIIQLIIFTGLGIWIIFYMFGKMSPADKEQMMSSLKQTRLIFCIPVFFISFLSHYFRAKRWQTILESIDIKVSTKNITLSVLIGYITNLALPRLGEVVKCTVLAKYENAPPDKLVGTIVAERLFDTLCLGVLVLITLLVEGDVFYNFLQEKLGHITISTTAIVGVVFVALAGIFFLRFFLKKFPDNKVVKIIKHILDGLTSLFRIKKKGYFLLYTFLIWFCYGFCVQLGFWSLPPTDHLGASAAIVILVFGSVGMIATQGGIGAYTYLCAQALLMYHIAEADGVAFGWLSWFFQTGIILVLGILSLILLPIVNRNKRAANPENQ